MELNINFKIDVTERTSACVASLTQLLQRMTDVSTQAIQAPATVRTAEEAREEPRQQAQEQQTQEQQAQEQKPARARTAPKTSRKATKTEAEPVTAETEQETAKPEPVPEAKQTDIPSENPETAKNVGNDMPMDDGSRKEEQNETQSRDELISGMRKAMNECMERFIGPDYKNQTNTATYKKYNGMLRTHFMRLASTLAANGDYHLKPNETMKPSMLNEKDLKSFIAEVDLLVPDPKTGEISKGNFF